MDKRLYCGAGREEITPPEELLKNLVGIGDTPFGGIHDALYVRILVLACGERRVMLVGYDLDKAPFPEEYTRRLEEETGIPAQNILYFAIHAHAVPIIGSRPFEKRNDAANKPPAVQEAVHAYERYVLKRLLVCAGKAAASLIPVRIGTGYGRSCININRVALYPLSGGGYDLAEGWNTEEGMTDPTLFLMRLEDYEGKPVAFVINYAMHNTGMFLNDPGDGKMLVSSDIGGAVEQELENAFPGAVALWTSGAAGDVNCLLNSSIGYPDPVTGEIRIRDFRQLESAAENVRLLSSIHFRDILKTNSSITATREEADIRVKTAVSRTPCYVSPLAERENAVDEENTYQIRLRLLQIGSLALIGIDGELYTRLGKVIREASPVADTVLITHESSLLPDNPGYIFDDVTIESALGSRRCTLPGWKQFRAVPGTIAPALRSCVGQLFD